MFRRAATVIIAVAGLQAGAAERGEEMAARSRTLASANALEGARPTIAPFTAAYDPIPGLLQRDELAARKPQGACEANARDLCYDMVERRIVYRPVRQYMPRVDGLTAESVSLRHDRLVLKYSFR